MPQRRGCRCGSFLGPNVRNKPNLGLSGAVSAKQWQWKQPHSIFGGIVILGGEGLARPLAPLWVLVTCLLASATTARAQFPCDSTVYIVQESQLQRIDTSTNPVTLDPIGPPHTNNYNALGYNFVDGLIYGYDLTLFEFVQVDELGAVTTLGDGGIPTATYINGDVDPAGNMYLASGTTLYRLDLTVLPGPLVAETITLDASVGLLADFAFSPRTGLLYGTTGGNLYTIDPNAGPGTGTVITTPITGEAGASTGTGAAWFDPFGDLYVYRNNPGTVYRVNTTTAVAEFISTSPTVSNVDGTRCSVGVGLRKGVSSPEVQPGETVTFTIEIANTGDPISPDVILDLTDSLPAGFTYVSGTVMISGAVSNDGPVVTSDTLAIDNIQIAPNTDVTITIDAIVSGTVEPGTYPSQAAVAGVPPSAGGPTVFSTPANGVGPGPTIVSVPSPDLVIDAVDDTSLAHDPQTGAVTGTAEVTVRNAGFGASSEDFEVTLFADVDDDGVFTPGTDTALGTQTVAGGLIVDATSTLMFPMPAGATLDFPNQPILAFVDSGGATNEVVEANNYGTSAATCPAHPPSGAITPVLEWRFDDVPTGGSSAMVADMNQDGVPDIIYVDVDPVSTPLEGVLRVVDGLTKTVLWVSAGIDPVVTPAVADIDADGLPEVIAATPLIFPTFPMLVAFEHDGAAKWTNTPAFLLISDAAGFGLGIADFDADGAPEVYYGAQTFDAATGVQEWVAPGFLTPGVSVAVDVTRDGIPELIAAGVIYNASGDAIGNVQASHGIAFGSFDSDTGLELFGAGVPNTFTISKPSSETEATGSLRAGVYRAPLVVDLDGDGESEIVVSGSSRLEAFDGAGTVLWSVLTGGTAAHRATPTAFDLNGDGAMEVLAVSETYFMILDASGTEIFSTPWDYMAAGYSGPIVADVDADGVVEIVLSGGFGNDPTNVGGIHVFGPAGGDWAPARTVWNQHPYYRDNVNTDATIPTNTGLPWRTHNTFRVQAPACWDLAAARLTVDVGDLPDSVEIGVRVGNGGTEPLPVGTPVAIYDGDPNAGGTLIGTVATTTVIAPGDFEQLSFVWNDPPAVGSSPVNQPIFVVVDDDGAGIGNIREPEEDNNELSISFEVADRDDDGVVDALDPDDDNDGVLDIDEGATTGLDPSGDEDMDGTPNYADENVPGFVDSNNDGVDDRVDRDLDGVPNQLDLDSDNDGIPDLVENATATQADALDANRDGLPDDTTDADGDGVLDVFDSAPTDPGVSTSVLPVTDTDGDSTPDVYDLDADGDGIYDIVEADGDDADGDGRVDGFTDGDDDGYAQSVDPTEGGTALPIPDTDDDGAFDFQDTDSDDDQVPDATEGHDVNADGAPDVLPSGTDSDQNGVDDAYDTNGTPAPRPDRDDDGTPDFRDVDDDNDGRLTYDGSSQDEDTDGDGDPTNDDSDRDGIPNYLDNDGGVAGGSLGCALSRSSGAGPSGAESALVLVMMLFMLARRRFRRALR